MTFRAVRILKRSRFILAAKTRTSGKLLKRARLALHMYSHHMHNEHKTVENLIAIEAGETIALISDAGTPAISIRFPIDSLLCRKRHHCRMLPGATAFVPCLGE
jgi:16S rRNA (cytidine1402-2'-O)-methyltransferase